MRRSDCSELWTYFRPFSSVSIVNFEQLNAGWVFFIFFQRLFIFVFHPDFILFWHYWYRYPTHLILQLLLYWPFAFFHKQPHTWFYYWELQYTFQSFSLFSSSFISTFLIFTHALTPQVSAVIRLVSDHYNFTLISSCETWHLAPIALISLLIVPYFFAKSSIHPLKLLGSSLHLFYNSTFHFFWYYFLFFSWFYYHIFCSP